MKIRPKIPMLLGGNNIWYNGILDYDPIRYTHAYDTSRLVNPLNFGEAWASRTNGLGRGRYVPNPSFSRDLVRNIELNNTYYKRFTDALFNTDGTLSDVGKAYARLSDNLLPENSLARVYNGNLIRSNWTTTNNDTYGRPGNSFNNVKDYLYYERNDNLPGGRHNVFLDKGKRYFYVDNEGKYHWVSPEDASKYLVSEKPVEYGWGDDGVYWEDYELTGSLLGDKTPSEVVVTPERKQTDIPADGGKKYGFDWNKIKEVGAKIFGNPDLYGIGRLAGNLNNNNRVYDEALKAIRPVLRLTYNTHRQVVGDEATKQAYYRRAVLGQTKAARPFTSDADRLMAYQFEAKRVSDELRALGDLADNQEIRRTSDESNQHEWANAQRAAEVANANIASLNQTNAAKHNLLALKHSALWSSIDNYLKELEYRKRQQIAENLDLEDLIYMLDLLDFLYTPEYAKAYEKYNSVLEKHKKADGTGYDLSNPDVIQARGEFLNAIREYKKRQLLDYYEYKKNRKSLTGFLKLGSKITRKNKDDLLYKSAKDVVEHFRKMSKMSSDASNKKIPKIEKLTSHPKGKARKYQLGGLAPFTVYTPVAMGGETSRSSEYGSSSKASSSSKDNEGKETLDLVKSLFEKVLGKGLPIDVNSIYAQMSNLFSLYKAFGKELDTDDIAMLYLQSMQSLSNVMYSKEAYDKAKLLATQNEALDEFAVNALGHFVVQDTETGKISTEKSWEDVLKSGKNPITNAQLLYMRAYNPELSSQRGDELIERVVNNGMGINKIGAQIKALAGNIGSYEGKIEGLTQVESNQVKSGLLLLANAPDGYYKHTVEDKNQQTLMKAAIGYITNMLSPSQRAILDAHGGADKLIPMFLASQENITHNVSFLPLTGKTSDKDKKDTISATFNDLLLRGQVGVPREFSMITKDENTKLYSLDAKYISQLPKVNSDMSIDRMLAESEVGKILDSRLGITFGDQVVNPENLKDIMFSVGGGATVVTLPCKYENGHKVVNFAIKDEFDEAIKEASKSTPIDWTNNTFKLNLANILKQKGLDSLLTTGTLLDPNMLGQFLVVEGYSTDRVKFNKNSKYIEKVSNPTKELEERLNLALSTKGLDGKVLKYDVDINDWGLGFLFEGGWDDIYHANVFIPLNNDPISALIGSSDLDRSEAKLLASEYLNYLKLIRAKNTDSNLL